MNIYDVNILYQITVPLVDIILIIKMTLPKVIYKKDRKKDEYIVTYVLSFKTMYPLNECNFIPHDNGLNVTLYYTCTHTQWHIRPKSYGLNSM